MDGYRDLRLLADGGTARVWAAVGNEGRVAVKVLHAELATEGEAERLHETAEALRRLDEPGLVKILRAGTTADGLPYTVMELVEGVDLATALSERTALPWPEVAAHGIQLAKALAALHMAGFVHLDVKPGNVMIAAARAKLLDLGQVRPTGGHVGPPPRLGTPEYWSPEQACGGTLGEASDVYSLGVVLYEMLTGRVPFRSHSYSEVAVQHLRLTAPAPRAPEGQPTIPTPLAEVVTRCLAKRPEDRHASAAALAEALARAIPAAPPVPRPARGRMGRALLAVAGLVALLAGAAVALRHAPRAVPSSALVPPAAPATPPAVPVSFVSEPAGARIYRAAGGGVLGTTPVTLEMARSADPVEVLFRLEDGREQRAIFRPDRTTVVSVQLLGSYPAEQQ